MTAVDQHSATALLRRDELHASVTDPTSASMNFLNEIAERYPDAISLAAGRPYGGLFRTEDISRHLATYSAYLTAQGRSPEQISGRLMQYGRTNGFIHDLIARTLATDEGIDVPPEAVMVTTGCQEAMVIVLRGLCSGPQDVILAASPCYVGITGAARLLDIDVVGVPETAGGLDPAEVVRVVADVRASGRRPRALYLVPDFANPSGACLSVAQRQGLLDVAREEQLLILEDDPYGLFGLDDRARPSSRRSTVTGGSSTSGRSRRPRSPVPGSATSSPTSRWWPPMAVARCSPTNCRRSRAWSR